MDGKVMSTEETHAICDTIVAKIAKPRVGYGQTFLSSNPFEMCPKSRILAPTISLGSGGMGDLPSVPIARVILCSLQKEFVRKSMEQIKEEVEQFAGWC